MQKTFEEGEGNVDSVKLLLEDPKVDPSADNNFAVKLASWYAHLEVVKILLADERVANTYNK